ncbi:MAG: glycosyltransferase family 2 protein [Thermosynechococcaceae cyanobacterium]
MDLRDFDIAPPVDHSPRPLFSIVITNYNYGCFLRESIDSVLSQTYNNFELIVVDDGSSDQSIEIIHSYGDEIIPIFQGNCGMSAARNIGFRTSEGTLLSFLDADDFYQSDRLANVVETFAQHPDWIMLSHLWTTVDKTGKPTGKSTSNILSQGDVRPLLLKWGKYASGITSALAFRRAALAQIMPVSGNLGLDSYANAALPFYGQIGSINQPFMFYRIHGSNQRAHSTDLDRLIQQREAIATYINQAAKQQGLQETFNIYNDVDYQVYKIVAQGQSSLTKVLRIIWLSLRESIGIKRSFRDCLIRLLTRVISVIPGQGILIFRHGLRGYFRIHIFRTNLMN